MKNEELDRLHSALLILADEVDRLCRSNNISYTLVGGSMLGAVRHKGFIPWDDDMDIAMRRAEFDKFIVACQDNLGDDFQVLTNTNNDNYVYGFAKIQLKGTSLVEYELENVKYPQAIFLDIFCFDNIPDNIKLRKQQKRKNYFLIKLLRQTQGLKDNPEWSIFTKFVFKVLKLLSVFRKKSAWVKALNDNMIKYNCIKTQYVCNMAGFWGYDRETIPSYSLDHISYFPFEDREYQMCENYDEILKHFYGNYMELPPVEKRHSHGFSKIDFGKY